MENFGLSDEIVNQIKAVFSKYNQIDQVLIYGSRAKGNYLPFSDIDFTLLGYGIDLTILFKIEQDLDDLLLPYKFDISIFSKISDTEFINHINRIGQIFYKK